MDEPNSKRHEYKIGNAKPRFFIYAPPLFTNRKSKRMLPNKPFRNAEKWQHSIYYYWYEYLRRSDDYKKCCERGGKGKLAKLYADFGDVFDTANIKQEAFKNWWRQHANLFWEADGRKVDEASVVNDIENTDLIVRLPLEVRTSHIVRNVRRLLGEHEKRVKKARAKSRTKYPVLSKVRLATLQKHLDVYDALVANPKLKLHELADEAGLMVDDFVYYYDENGDLAGKKTINWLWRNGYDNYAKDGEKVLKRRKRQIARQHLEAAKEYISNVESGKFPLRKR